MKSLASESVYLERLSRRVDVGANLADGFGSDAELSKAEITINNVF